MRTTLTLDDHLASALQEAARRSGRPFKQIVNETLRRGLHDLDRPPARAYRLPVAALGLPRPGVDLDKALALADGLEDSAVGLKLELRK
jgi:hypothetical protein